MPEPIRPQPRTPTFLMDAMGGAPFENRAGLYAARRHVAATTATSDPPRPRFAAERLGERDDLSAAAGVPDDDARRDAADRRPHRRLGRRAGVDPQARCRDDVGPPAAAEAADRDWLRAGGPVARMDRGGRSMAERARRAAAGPDRPREPPRAARRDDRRCDARGEPREGVRIPPCARPHRGGGKAAAGVAGFERTARAP